MSAAALSPDEVSYKLASGCCSSAGQPERAEALRASARSPLVQAGGDEAKDKVPSTPSPEVPTDRSLLSLRGRADGHAPVLWEAVVEALLGSGSHNGTFVDCTFGRGGHSRALLERLSQRGRVLAFDVDPSAISEAGRLAARDPRLVSVHRPFGDLAEVLPHLGVESGSLSGVLADLGVSSPQLDQKHRGFSPIEDGPLDLRMNPLVGVPASEWLASVPAEELAWVLRAYGEDSDPFLAARIAESVVARARRGTLRRTTQLAEVVATVKAQHGGCSPFEQPARLTFQAIRSHLNQEFQQLDQLLSAAFSHLAVGGRVVVICFKRAEVAAVRRWLRRNEEAPTLPLRGGQQQQQKTTTTNHKEQKQQQQ
ncbi:unnamed protein product [Polarella glacialis]|uniref:Uncharacterized protein n=1 Tax=Polarella glacialis TaxID=89957 RepID=A0A813I017_POLGL|nr:unnamed protein product [Polarella glacialis]